VLFYLHRLKYSFFFHHFVFSEQGGMYWKRKNTRNHLEFACRKHIKEKVRPGSEFPLLLFINYIYIYIYTRVRVLVEEKYSYWTSKHSLSSSWMDDGTLIKTKCVQFSSKYLPTSSPTNLFYFYYYFKGWVPAVLERRWARTVFTAAVRCCRYLCKE